MNAIGSIRVTCDLLFNLIQPHITMVFPFESEICSNEQRQHVQNSINGQALFETVQQRVSGFGDYLAERKLNIDADG